MMGPALFCTYFFARILLCLSLIYLHGAPWKYPFFLIPGFLHMQPLLEITALSSLLLTSFKALFAYQLPKGSFV